MRLPVCILLAGVFLYAGITQGAPPEKTTQRNDELRRSGGDPSTLNQKELRDCAILIDPANLNHRKEYGLDDHLIRIYRTDPNVVTIVNNGPIANRVDIVYLGDGYTSAEQTTFATDVDNISGDFFLEPPFDVYANYFNVHRVEVISNESGVDVRDDGIYKDTALDMWYQGGGVTRMGINLGKARDAAAFAPDEDTILALANSSMYGGTAYYGILGMSPGHNYSSSNINLHEFGHSFGNLGDEYVTHYGETWMGSELWQANLSIHEATEMTSLQTKWYRWLDHPDVSTVEGGGYYSYGIYRSHLSTKMRSNGSPFREVNTEQFIRMIYTTVDPIDDATAASATPYLAGTTFSVTPMQPVGHSLDIQWFVDEVPVTGANSVNFTPDYVSLADGIHTVSVEVVDNTTAIRDENIRDSLMTSTRQWTVQGSWPGLPTGLVATAGSTSIMVDWDDNPEPDIDYYNVYRAEVAGGPYTLIDTTYQSDYEDDSVTTGVTYYYVVTAYASGNEGGYSNEDFGTPGVPMPTAPSNLTGTVGDTQVILDWDDNPEPNIAGYKVYHSLISGGPYTLLNADLQTTSDYVDTGLTNDTDYYYIVVARDTGGNESAPSTEIMVTPWDLPPAAPSNLSVVIGERAADLSWDANTEPDLRDYCIYQSETSGGPYEEIDCDDVTFWPMRGLTNGVTYYWVVAATDEGGNYSPYSNEVSGTPWNMYPPDPISGLTAEGRYLSVFLDWDDNDEEDLDEYKVYQAENAGGPWTEVDATGVSEFLVTGLTGEVTYYYYVTAVDTAGNESGHDDEVSATPTSNAPPAAPTGLTGTPGDGYAFLDWNDNSEPDLQEYRIYMSMTAGGPYDEVDSDDPSEFPIYGLNNGTTYYFVVTAVDTAGWESPYSNEVSVTPGDDVPPAAPANLTGYPMNGAAFIDWTANTEPDIREYYIYQSTTSGGPYDEIDNDDVTEWTIYGLNNGTTYYFVVTAMDSSNNESAYSNEVAVIPSATALPLPPLDLAANGDDRLVELEWRQSFDPAVDYYNIYRSTTAGGPYTFVNDTPQAQYEDDGLTANVTYYYVVTTVNDQEEESVYSNEASATPWGPPAPPENVSASAGSSSVNLYWDWSNDNRVGGYGVYRATVSGGPYQQAGATQDNNYTDTNVVSGTTYYYVVVCIYNGQEESDYSLEVSATVGGCSSAAECDDGLYCNGAEDCVGGACVAGTAINCNDGIDCTDDSCNEATDSCDNIPEDSECDNQQYCDGAETCDPAIGCVTGTPVDCDDGVNCTTDTCNEATDSCDNVANNAYCDNGLYCDGIETCSATLGCQAGTVVDCDDGVDCTDDSCNETTDSCDNVANNANCDNGLFCDGVETCDPTLDCQAGSDPCPGSMCSEDDDMCVECIVDGDCDDGNPCTEDTCDAGTCVNDGPPAISSFPYSEDWESGFGEWTNVSGDNFDWIRRSGSTPSSGTGPSDAYSGTYYVYVEASSPNYSYKTTILEGPHFDLTNTTDADLTFAYHMLGSAVGTLYVEVSNDCTNWTAVWTLSGDQGSSWHTAEIDLSAYTNQSISIRLRAVTGSSWQGDICVDALAVTVVEAIPCDDDTDCDDGLFCNGAETCVGLYCQSGSDPCPGQLCNEDTDSCETAECFDDGDCDDSNECTVDTCVNNECFHDFPNLITSFPHTEGFEGGWGDWENSDGDDINWTRRSGSTPSGGTGPSGAHGGSYYIYTEASSPNYPSKTAILESPNYDLTGVSDAELSFWYNMYGTSMGTLYVEVSTDCENWTTVWSLSGNQGSTWYEVNVDLGGYVGSVITLRFRGVTGSSYRSDMAVDDVIMSVTP